MGILAAVTESRPGSRQRIPSRPQRRGVAYLARTKGLSRPSPRCGANRSERTVAPIRAITETPTPLGIRPTHPLENNMSTLRLILVLTMLLGAASTEGAIEAEGAVLV